MGRALGHVAVNTEVEVNMEIAGLNRDMFSRTQRKSGRASWRRENG